MIEKDKLFYAVHKKLQQIPKYPKDTTRLDLRRNEIVELDLEYSENIIYFDISDNRISEMKNLEKFPNLEVLDLSYNLFTKLNIPNKKLKELYVICNDIEKIENINNVNKLDLAGNRIEVIENLQECSDLVELYLGNNKIRNVNDMSYLSNLELLDLQCNQIQTLDCSVLPSSIRTLILTDNRELYEIKNLDKLINLKLLAIERTKIKDIEIKGNMEVWYK